jgi:predicted secreted protein
MLRIPLSIIFTCLAVISAHAADSAERRIIGFSPDGKWFAFEQFGTQDGSGFPYHEVFVVDVLNDEWASGTPIRVRIDDETATPLQARNQARTMAAAELAKHKIVRHGHVLASNPVTEIDPTPNEVSFFVHRNWTGPQDPYTLSLETFVVPKSENCSYSDSDMRAFYLKLKTNDGIKREVYRDKDLPKSRGCAHGYQIADVIIHEERLSPERLVVLLHVFTQGFEGSDARFIAIPITAPHAPQ